MIALALLLALQQPDTNIVLPSSVRALVDRFPPPPNGQPSISVRFSHDTVWPGEQVELVTATWFPRPLRDRLRRQPMITTPSLTGAWSARSQSQPVQAITRVVGHQLYDLYISYQTIFPLSPGHVDAPSAALSYGVPTSTSYFAPEERRVLRSDPAVLHVRALPAAIATALGTGPTARLLHVAWRGPAGALRVGAPAIVELVVTGEGNLTLWPSPAPRWPAGVHVYPEPTEENTTTSRGMIGGEKRFRYTLVPDTAGVLTLPVVTYPYFDPDAVEARTAATSPLELPVLPRTSTEGGPAPLPLALTSDVPLATTIVTGWWWVLALVLAGVPIAFALTHTKRAPKPVPRTPGDPETALRRALGTPLDASPERVVRALRRRGVPRSDAEHVHRWLSASARRQYGPQHAEVPAAPAVIEQILRRLQHGLLVIALICVATRLRARQISGADRYAAGDYSGAVIAFNQSASVHPEDAATWQNLGAAEWMQGESVRAAAAWLAALRLAPRDTRLQEEWDAVPAVPADVRNLPPGLPVSRDEVLVIAVLAWGALWGVMAVRRRWMVVVIAAITVGTGALAIARTIGERHPDALVTTITPLRVSPNVSTTTLAEVSAWSQVNVVKRSGDWLLVQAQLPSGATATDVTEGWLPRAAVALIGPLN